MLHSSLYLLHAMVKTKRDDATASLGVILTEQSLSIKPDFHSLFCPLFITLMKDLMH